MADISLDELIRKRGAATKGRLSTRPGVGGVRSRIGIQQSLLSQSTRTATFQQRFDARQKIGLSDARLKLGVKDAREKLLQKDARFRIKGKVQDAREMLNSRKQQSTVPPKPRQVADARETISLKRRSPAAFTSPPVGTVTPALKLTKTIQVPQQKPMVPLHAHPAGMRINVVNNHQAKQNLYDLDEEDDVLAPIPAKQMKFSASGSFLPHTGGLLDSQGCYASKTHGPHSTHGAVSREDLRARVLSGVLPEEWARHVTAARLWAARQLLLAGLSTSKLSMSKALPLTKVVQNDAYTAPALPSIRTKALTSMSRTLVNKEEAPKELPSAEAVLSPLEGTKMTVNNLHPRVTEEDIVELFCVCGALKRARLVHPGVAEVVFVKKDDAITAYKKYNNRCLDGQPMKCNLHMNGHVITSEQPILLRLSDSPAVKKESELPRRVAPAAAASPAAEVDPDTILKALFKSSGASVTTQPTEFKIKL